MPDLLEMRSICKQFGGVQALRDVSLRAQGGQVHALLGENGAGKSTLMKILSGAHRPDKGAVFLNDRQVDLSSTQAARENGIAVIYQEFSLATHLSVAENIFIDDLGFGSRRVNWKRLKRRAEEQVASLGMVGLNVLAPVADLSVAQQQIVEICKALHRNPRVVVFDEPTAVLTESETSRLFETIRRLKRDGVCVIYISHRLEEVFELCQSFTVLKDGACVTSMSLEGIDRAQIVRMMVGRELKDLFPKRNAVVGAPVLEVRNLEVQGRVRDVSFSARAGEVLGFCGLVGAGRTEIMRAIFGADKPSLGKVLLHGKPVNNRTPTHAVKSGIGMLPEDRKHQGVLLDQSIRNNAMLRPSNPFARILGWINHRAEYAETERIMRTLKVKARDADVDVWTLSGGNQQKVALAKWVFSECDVLIFDEPTRGVDVGAKVEIYHIINDLAQKGKAIIVVSSELPELVGLCDRVLVIREGRIVGEVSGGKISEDTLIGLAMGVH